MSSVSEKSRFKILLKVEEDYFAIVEKEAELPASHSIFVPLTNRFPFFPKRIFLFNKDETRLFRFATVPITMIPEVHVELPLRLTFNVFANGTMEVSWGVGSAKVVYDEEVFRANQQGPSINDVRRKNLRI